MVIFICVGGGIVVNVDVCPLFDNFFFFFLTSNVIVFFHVQQTVDQKKLEKAEAKIQKKQGKRTDLPKKPDTE